MPESQAFTDAIEQVRTVGAQVATVWRQLQDANAELEAARQAAFDAGATEEQVQAAHDSGAATVG